MTKAALVGKAHISRITFPLHIVHHNALMSHPQSICSSCLRALRLQRQLLATTSRRAQREFHRDSNALIATTTLASSPRAPPAPTRLAWPSNHTRTREIQSRSQTRSISSSTPLSKVIQNPRFDDDGNEMLLRISPRASNVSDEATTCLSSILTNT